MDETAHDNPGEGIRAWLAENHLGQGAPLTWEAVGQWIQQKAFSATARADRELAKKRQELYEANGDKYMVEMVDDVFEAEEVKAKRRKMIRTSKWNNVLKRIVNARAKVYTSPAVRRVGGEESNQETYNRLLELAQIDAQAITWNQWGELHNQIVVGYRINRRQQKPKIDIITPDSFFTLHHPLDATELIAIGLRLDADGPKLGEDPPRWVVWTTHEWFYLRENGSVVSGSQTVHGWRRRNPDADLEGEPETIAAMPYILYSAKPPRGKLVDYSSGEERCAAHMSVWFQNVCLSKETKSATKIPVLAGDFTRSARDQAADSEVPVEVGDGATVSAVDLSMDLSMFRSNENHIFETAASNDDIAPGLLRHRGVQSAQARRLQNEPLEESSEAQERYLEVFERDLALVMEMVTTRDLPSRQFLVESWSITFTKRRISIDPKAENEVFEKERRLGLTSTILEIMRRFGMDVEEAQSFLRDNIQAEVDRNTWMRPLTRIAGSAGSPVEVQETEDAADPESGEQQAPPANGRETEGMNE